MYKKKYCNAQCEQEFLKKQQNELSNRMPGLPEYERSLVQAGRQSIQEDKK